MTPDPDLSKAALPAIKYAKIQPAIAIKPKPSLQAVAPKPAFNPRYDPTASPAVLEDALINTLRKWVLPPRPRPGRKPTTATPEKTHQKKQRCLKAYDAAEPLRAAPPFLKSLSPCPGSGQSPALASAARASGLAASHLPSASSGPPPLGLLTPTSLPAALLQSTPVAVQPGGSAAQGARVRELQTAYLAKLKEQDLVQNYIEILTNQIKDLKFVQSGVITFAALNSSSASKPRAASLPAEQLDHINNVCDLDLFLAHQTTQANVIHSVTKKFVGDSTAKGNHVELQIGHYLKLRASHDRPNGPGHSAAVLEDGARGAGRVPDGLTATRDKIRMSEFTPSLLQPLDAKLFEEDDKVINVDIIHELDVLAAIQDKPKLEAAEADLDILSLSLEFRGYPAAARARRGCGFCFSEGPCQCYEADTFLDEK